MKFLDLFSGIGGFRLGMERAGHECVGYVEWDKYARKSYEAIHNTEGEWTAHDITTVTDDDLRLLRYRGIDVICGGFPCQSFSVAGKRGGFSDTRGTMFFEIARIAKQIKPRFLFLENVKGLLSHDQGNTFGTILHTLDELGYDAEWQVLNSKNFGVPQNRERVFIIGHLRGSGGREVFPITGENGQSIKTIGHINPEGFRQTNEVLDIEGICTSLRTFQGGGLQPKILVAGQLDRDLGGTDKVYDQAGIAPTQLAQQGNAVTKVLVVGNTNPSGNGMNGSVYDAEGLAPTLTTNKGEGNKILVNVSQKIGVIETDQSPCLDANCFKGLGGNQTRTSVMEPIPVLTPDRIEIRQCGRRFKEPGEPMFTLTAQDRHGVTIIDDQCRLNMTRGNEPKVVKDYRIRKLTPKECFRLQSFPDWVFDKAAEVNSDSQLYKQAGNSVTVNVIYEIAKRFI